jgi:NAD(P)-dependent dehydrogenase (short-subunit alcohol dehydrogenase family)
VHLDRRLPANAGNDIRHAVTEIEPAYWDERMRVNLDHMFFAAQAVAHSMRTAGSRRRPRLP